MNTATVIVRPEVLGDILPISKVNMLAFGQPTEGDLVNELRRNRKLLVSLVAERGGMIVGHIAFSVVIAVNAASEDLLAGLAPMAVLPEFQKQGIGSRLVLRGIEECRNLGVRGIVVLGHPDYYPRFGFQPASRFGLRCEYDAPDEAFMALELKTGALVNLGLVRYQPEFGSVEGGQNG
jgi:putative acetyltransferase